MNNNLKITISIACLVLTVGAWIAYGSLFGAPQKQTELEQFTIPTTTVEDHDKKIIDDSREIAEKLKAEGFIKSIWAFNIALGFSPFSRCVDCIMPGAFKISKAMNAWEIANILAKKPYMVWVVIPEGLRKEQIAELLADALDWDTKTKSDWVNKYTAMQFDYIEGVYFPDTYLIPVNEPPLGVADRLRAKFNENFAPYAQEAINQNIKWDTLLKIASIVQREAAGNDDMPLIAGILWNRLLKDMKLEVDATIQYINDSRQNYLGIQCAEITPCPNQELVYIGSHGKENGWWQPIKATDIQKTSPYNTYLNKGLPPHPIANSGLDAIKAVLYPEETKCLFYLHDESKKIHCAETYEDHQENIKTFLQ